MRLWGLTMQGRLLRIEGGLQSLAEKLGVKVLGNPELLLEIILPDFDNLAEHVRETAMNWIVLHWDEIKGNEAVCKLLSSTRFVHAGMAQ